MDGNRITESSRFGVKYSYPYTSEGNLPVTQLRIRIQNEGLTPFLYPYHDNGFRLCPETDIV